MSARKLEAYEFEQAPESKQTPLYQDYTPEAPVGPNLKEILFIVDFLLILAQRLTYSLMSRSRLGYSR